LIDIFFIFFKKLNMNRLLILSAVVLAIFGCGETATPEKTAIDFAVSMDKGDFKAAKELGTESTKKLLEMIEPMIAGMGDLAKSGMGKGKFEKATCEGTEDKKTCKVCCDEEGADKEFVLIKENGKWLVDMNKDQMKKDESPEGAEGETPDSNDVQAEPAPAEHGSGH
jgi:hypothetical protein